MPRPGSATQPDHLTSPTCLAGAQKTQIRYRHTKGRAYYDKKLAEGKTPKEALRALKRQVSDAIFACLQADAQTAAAAAAKSPGGQSGNGSGSSAAGSHPERRLFGQATPGPCPSLRPLLPELPLDTKRHSICMARPHWVQPSGDTQNGSLCVAPGRR